MNARKWARASVLRLLAISTKRAVVRTRRRLALRGSISCGRTDTIVDSYGNGRKRLRPTTSWRWFVNLKGGRPLELSCCHPAPCPPPPSSSFGIGHRPQWHKRPTHETRLQCALILCSSLPRARPHIVARGAQDAVSSRTPAHQHLPRRRRRRLIRLRLFVLVLRLLRTYVRTSSLRGGRCKNTSSADAAFRLRNI